jgi:alpha-ketoglutarate-dependent taurine dioxygenase
MSAANSRNPTQAMKIEKVKEHIGAIVTGIDLAQPIDAATQKKLYDAVVENVVLVIRGQEHLTPGQLQAAGELFGELMEDQNRRYLVDGFPLISVLDNRHLDSKGQPAKVGANATWHTDHTNQELPPKFTMLYAVAVPDKGGATSVCNSRAAYEALPDDMKLKIADAKTENTLISTARMKTGNPDVVKAQLESTKAADGASAGPHPPGYRHEGRMVSQGQDRDGHRHVTRRNPGFSAGFDRSDHAAAILLCARVSKGRPADHR